MEGVRTGAIDSDHVPAATSSPTRRGSSATCATFFPPQRGHVPDRPDGEARLGHADADQRRRSASSSRSPATSRSSACCKVALPTEDAALIVLQVNFVGAIEFDKQAASGSSPRCSSRASCSSRSRARWACSSRSATTPTSCVSVGGFHPRFNPPPLPFPTPAAHRAQHPQQPTSRASASRRYFAVTSNTVQFGARAELFFGFDDVQRRGPPRLRRAVPVLAVLLHHRDLGVGLAEGVRRRPVQHPPAASRSRARRRGARRAPARSRCCSSTSRRLRHHLGRDAGHRRCRRSRCCRCSTPSSTRPRTGAPCCRPAATCWCRCARSPAPKRRSCCTRSARCA